MESYEHFPPIEIIDFIPFFHTPLYFDGSFLHQKYVVEGRSAAQIADEIFSSKSTVLKALKEHQIEIREPHTPHGNPSQCRYGKKKWGGREVDHSVEQKVVKAVIEMKESNMGLRKIAQILTQTGLPTKGSSKTWHPEMVRRILSKLDRPL